MPEPAALHEVLATACIGGADGVLHPDASADIGPQLHRQARNAWAHEPDLRPYRENFR